MDFAETLHPEQNFGGKRVHWGDSEPASPSDGMLWFEGVNLSNTRPYFPRPWNWNGSENVWLSQPILFDYGSQTVTSIASGQINRLLRPMPFYNVAGIKGIFLDHIFGIVRTDNSANAHTAWNATAANNAYCSLRLEMLLGSGTITTIYEPPQPNAGNPVDTGGCTISMTTSGGSSRRRFTLNPQIFIRDSSGSPSTVWALYSSWVRQGTLSLDISLISNLLFYFRFARA